MSDLAQGLRGLATWSFLFGITGIQSVAGVVLAIAAFLTLQAVHIADPPLRAPIVILSQGRAIRDISTDDVDAFLSSVNGNESDSDWSCDSVTGGVQRWGQPATIATIRHRSHMPHDSGVGKTMRDLALRDLARKLAGSHNITNVPSRVFPEWEIHEMTDEYRTFGSCLILMQLKEVFELEQNRLDKRQAATEWAGQILNMLDTFFHKFDQIVDFLSDEDMGNIYRGFENGSNIRGILNLLQRLLQSLRDGNTNEMRRCQEEFNSVPNKRLVELMMCTAQPLARYGRSLDNIIKGLDPHGSESLVIEQLAKTLRDILGSSTLFAGAVGALARDVKQSRDKGGIFAVIFGVASVVSAVVMPPLLFITLPVCVAASCGFEYHRKGHNAAKSIQEAGENINLEGASFGLYVLVVLSRAGSFFTRDSSYYNSYKNLLHSVFGIEIESEEFCVDHYVKERGQGIVRQIREIDMKVGRYARTYGQT